jgi:3',5'-cyclic AMP phosphodiesterase CpdA
MVVLVTIVGGVVSRLEAAPPEPVEGGFSLVVIPDSQNYVWKRPELYTLQTGWIAANVARYRIQHVLHVGDVTQHNTPEQWELARRAHRVYEDLVPAAYVPGNHDLGPRGNAAVRETLFSEYLPLAGFKRWPGFGGVYDREPGRTENSFHRFTAGGREWLILALEFGPRDDVLRWANQVVVAHPRHSTIILTHAYLRPDGSRYDRAKPLKRKDGRPLGLERYALDKSPEGFNHGQDVWDKLASRHGNVVMVVSGHICTSAHTESRGVAGNVVHEILVDYQDSANGGDGWFRLMQFLPDGKTVRVRDYSPLRDETASDPAYAFEVQIAPPMP